MSVPHEVARDAVEADASPSLIHLDRGLHAHTVRAVLTIHHEAINLIQGLNLHRSEPGTLKTWGAIALSSFSVSSEERSSLDAI
jgi:hypothetical protein